MNRFFRFLVGNRALASLYWQHAREGWDRFYEKRGWIVPPPFPRERP